MRVAPPTLPAARRYDILAALSARHPIPARLALVVAHPDDETIAAGASLHLMPGLLLIHVTDGAPRHLDDATHAGFDTPQAYATAREAELTAALALSGASPERLALDIPDQEAIHYLRPITTTLEAAFTRHAITAVLTHAYEGGHPDHDATALAAHKAARRLGLPLLEFPAYHAEGGAGTIAQRFLPGPPQTRIVLDPAETASKRAMLACFHTQSRVLAMFDPATERFRPAPIYDFTAPPHPGPLNYETWGWNLTGDAWRARARTELQCVA